MADLVSSPEEGLSRSVEGGAEHVPEKIEQPRPHTNGSSPSLFKQIRSTITNIGSSLYEQQYRFAKLCIF